MLLAAMLAMALAVAAPALAQDDGGEEGGTTTNTNAALVNCLQIIQQVGGNQYATATGSGEGDVAAANNQEFSAAQVQICQAIAGQGNAAAASVGDVDGDGATEVDEDGDGTVDYAVEAGGEEAGAPLPDTGGYSLIALGAGALLVAGGLITRRFVR
jgi:LPXTG-motif cell wall-anchored protein